MAAGDVNVGVIDDTLAQTSMTDAQAETFLKTMYEALDAKDNPAAAKAAIDEAVGPDGISREFADKFKEAIDGAGGDATKFAKSLVEQRDSLIDLVIRQQANRPDPNESGGTDLTNMDPSQAFMAILGMICEKFFGISLEEFGDKMGIDVGGKKEDPETPTRETPERTDTGGTDADAKPEGGEPDPDAKPEGGEPETNNDVVNTGFTTNLDASSLWLGGGPGAYAFDNTDLGFGTSSLFANYTPTYTLGLDGTMLDSGFNVGDFSGFGLDNNNIGLFELDSASLYGNNEYSIFNTVQNDGLGFSFDTTPSVNFDTGMEINGMGMGTRFSSLADPDPNTISFQNPLQSISLDTTEFDVADLGVTNNNQTL